MNKRVNYLEYIQSNQWEQRSKMFIKQVGRCERCDSLHLLGCHHRTYDNLGCEKRTDVCIVCFNCYIKYCKSKKKFKRTNLTSYEDRLIRKK